MRGGGEAGRTYRADGKPRAGRVREIPGLSEVLEASDRWQGGRIFGNRKGKYTIPLERAADLYIFPALSQQRYKELNRLAEELFVR